MAARLAYCCEDLNNDVKQQGSEECSLPVKVQKTCMSELGVKLGARVLGQCGLLSVPSTEATGNERVCPGSADVQSRAWQYVPVVPVLRRLKQWMTWA